MPEKESTGHTITIADLFVEIRKLQEQMSALAPIDGTIKDHEIRIRSLEKWKYAIPPAFILAISSIALNYSNSKG